MVDKFGKSKAARTSSVIVSVPSEFPKIAPQFLQRRPPPLDLPMISGAPSHLGQAEREDGSAPCEFSNCVDARSVFDRASRELKKLDNKTSEDGGVWGTLDGASGTLPLARGRVGKPDLVEGRPVSQRVFNPNGRMFEIFPSNSVSIGE